MKQYDGNENNLPQVNNLFVGGIPPFLFFEMQCHSLFYLVESHKNDPYYKDINPAIEVATIGLIAHFEAFCKHHFAALINLNPELLVEFCKKRDEPKIEISTIISFIDKIESYLGFIISEHYDFGSGKLINGLFRDLLMVTPFSEKEAQLFDEILQKRNLLVHHAGYFTLQHLKKNKMLQTKVDFEFRDAVKITTEDFQEIWDFLFDMGVKIVRSTVSKLNADMKKNATLTSFQIDAFENFYNGLYDSLEE
mgnify:CR=1 FL=1|jgi:hypothetical protein